MAPKSSLFPSPEPMEVSLQGEKDFADKILALAGVAQWIEHWPACERKGHIFHSQSGHMPGPQLGACNRSVYLSHIDVPPPPFLPPFPSL